MTALTSDSRWHLLAFANARYHAARERLVTSAHKFGAASVHAHDPKSISSFAWCKRNRDIFRATTGAGYWLWKPFLILELLRSLPPDDFLIYADAGTEFVTSPVALFPLCRERNGLLMFQVHGYKNSTYVKRDCFMLMGCDTPHYWQAEQVNAAFLVLQRTPSTLSFIAEWAAWGDSHNLITDEPNLLGEPNLPGFIDHRRDQSILSLLAEKHGLLRSPDPSQWGEPYRQRPEGSFAPYPTIFNHHRQRTLFLRERLRMWLGARRHELFGQNNKAHPQ